MIQRLFLGLGLPALLLAHDLYIMPQAFVVPKGRLVIALHDGDAFPESEVAMRIERLRDARLLSAAGSSELKSPRVVGNRVLLDAEVRGTGDMIVTGRTVANFIELAPDKFLDYLKEEGLTHVIEWRSDHGESAKPGRERYSKYFKSIVVSGKPDEFFRHVVGQTIEIVPEKNPYLLRAGESLLVQVLFRGKPAAGLQIESAWAAGGQHLTAPVGVTGQDGRISVPIPKAGKYRLHALKMERCAEPTVADWESSWASLTFEIR